MAAIDLDPAPQRDFRCGAGSESMLGVGVAVLKIQSLRNVLWGEGGPQEMLCRLQLKRGLFSYFVAYFLHVLTQFI